MKMDEHARAWSHEFVSGVLQNAGLAPEQRSSLHWEILSHLHEKAERRVESRGGQYITLADIQAVVTELGGAPGVSAAFLQARVSANPRASFGKRFVAFILDAILIFMVVGLFYATVGWIFFFGLGPFGDVAWIALAFGYFALMELKWGQTVGKMVFNLRTVMVDGRPLTVEAALIRNVAKAIPFLLLIDVIIWLAAFRNEDQRASDRLAKTIVIDTTKANWSAPAPPLVTAPEPPPPAPTTSPEPSSPAEFRPQEPLQ